MLTSALSRREKMKDTVLAPKATKYTKLLYLLVIKYFYLPKVLQTQIHLGKFE